MAKQPKVMPQCRHCGAECEGDRHPVPDQWFCYACRRWQGDRYCPTCHGRVAEDGLTLGFNRHAPALPAQEAR